MQKNIALLKRIIGQGQSYIPFFVTQGFIGLIAMPLDLYALFLFRKLIDKGFLLQNWQTTKNILLVLSVLFIARSILTFAVPLFFAKIQLRMNRHFQNRLFTHILFLPVRFFQREPTGQLMSRLFSDANLFANIFNLLFNRAFLAPIRLLVLFAVLAYFSIQLCILLLAVSILSFLIIRRLGRRLHFTSKELQDQNAIAFSYAEQMLTHIELIKSKADEARTASVFAGILDQWAKLSLRTMKISLATQWMLQTLTYVTIGAVFLYGSWIVSKGFLSIGTLAAFIGLAYLFFNTIQSLGNAYGSLRETLARFEVLFSILDAHPEHSPQKPEAPPLSRIDLVEFEGIRFGYDPSRPVLEGISFALKRGATLGITGQSGSGKTTLWRLLARFYDPDSGDIKINKCSLKATDLRSLRSSLGIAFQENLILGDTVFNNLAYGRPEATEIEVIEAARTAQLHDFILSMPDQYATLIGENGKSLSGGQRQRLAIARALVSDPEILILDEATSFIEVEQEARILRKIKDVRNAKITIIISHRLSAMQTADRILRLDNGRLLQIE